jgi:hypothetical protein
MLGYALAGQFDGDDFEFQVGTALGAVSASYGVRTDACHVQYQTLDAYGRAAQSMIHMNHLPGQPCP